MYSRWSGRRRRGLSLDDPGTPETVIAAEHLEAWRGQSVIDPADEHLGKLEEVYLDTRNEEPVLIAVKSGLLGRNRHLIPVNDARVGPDFVRVAHARETVEGADAPAGNDAPGAAALESLGTAYGLRFAEGLRLEAASEVERRRAAAQEAREKAEELEAAAQEREAARETARQQAQGAGDEASRAEREAEEARRAADEARAEADRHGTGNEAA